MKKFLALLLLPLAFTLTGCQEEDQNKALVISEKGNVYRIAVQFGGKRSLEEAQAIAHSKAQQIAGENAYTILHKETESILFPSPQSGAMHAPGNLYNEVIVREGRPTDSRNLQPLDSTIEASQAYILVIKVKR